MSNATTSKLPRKPSAKTASTVEAAKGPKKELEFQLPPMSLPIPKAKEINFEELKKKTIRRNAPPGEDKKALAIVLRGLKDQKIRVHEFVNLIAPYTGDNGDVMRKVVEDDLASFRKLVTRIYDTMTQDVSDVLVNEQLQTAAFYQERCDAFERKTLELVSEIYQMAPEFDFDRYRRDKEEHLNVVLPLPTLIQRDEEDIQMQRRQEAFHRLQWLKIEGKRLAEENDRLHQRLAELRRQQKAEQERAAARAASVEAQKQSLEAEEAQKEEILGELGESIGRAMVKNEAFVQLEEELNTKRSMVAGVSGAVEPSAVGIPSAKRERRKKKSDWASRTAADLEEQSIRRAGDTQREQFDAQARVSRRARSPQTSPFHYSPPKSPPEAYLPLSGDLRETTVEQMTTTVHERRPQSSSSYGGRYRAPRDTWGGFA
ncbi:uncharacterized protein LOC132699584 [Cylas formicarius]|uniref:uncharacterized protein LOC132699584 n=1 Tax=Cylas formicarius TaxID=197179 RepID=UPI002958A947|nr:uncharacterized protein LOC132699584 [Cylas formicarius]